MRRRATGAGWAVLLLGLAGCARAGAAEGPGPLLFLSVNGAVGDPIELGRGFKVSVRIEGPEAGGSVELAPGRGTWVDALAVELVRADSGTVVARGEAPSPPPPASVTVGDEWVAGGTWRFPRASLGAATAGPHRVRARLAIPDGVGWTGAIAAEEPLELVARSTVPERALGRALAEAQDALDEGRPEEAARILDTALAASPGEPALLTKRAALSESGENPHAAHALLARAAIEIAKARRLPPSDWVEVRERVQASVFGPGDPAGRPEPAAWSWPPDSVIALPRDPPAGAAPAVPSTPPVPAGTGPASPIPEAELAPQKIAADPWGRWATMARASAGPPGFGPGSAIQAMGPPNATGGMGDPAAWCLPGRDAGTDWLELEFGKARPAVALYVRQTRGAGAIVKVEAIAEDATVHLWWEGRDPRAGGPADGVAWFGLRLPKTAYPVAKVRLTLDHGVRAGEKQVDAAVLVGAK